MGASLHLNRCLVASSPVQDLLLSAKDLFGAAKGFASFTVSSDSHEPEGPSATQHSRRNDAKVRGCTMRPLSRGNEKHLLPLSLTAFEPLLTPKRSFGSIHSTARWKRGIIPPLHE